MKKKILIIVILLLVLIPSCYFTYQYFTKEEDPEEVTEELKGKFANSNLKLDASLATQPLMDAYISYFADDNLLQETNTNYTNTHPAYVKLVDKELDLIIVTEPSEEELQYAKDNNVNLEVTKVVNEGFVFFTNANNKVDNLSLDDVVSIYSGKITNWSEVGGDNQKIIAYQRPANSGSQTGMLSLVMKDIAMKEPDTEEMIVSMAGIIDIVADYENDPNGLGYSYYYYANVMYGSPNIKFLGINGVKPTYQTIQDETYPLMTAYYIVTRSDASSQTLKFKEALLSQDGVNVAKEAGYVPIK